jgi:hypothetical protein
VYHLGIQLSARSLAERDDLAGRGPGIELEEEIARPEIPARHITAGDPIE